MVDDLATDPAATSLPVDDVDLRVELMNARDELAVLRQDAAATAVHLIDACEENATLLSHLRRLEVDLDEALGRLRGAESFIDELTAHAERVQEWSDGLADHTARVEQWSEAVTADRDAIAAQRDALLEQVAHDAPLARRYERLASTLPARVLRRLRRKRTA